MGRVHAWTRSVFDLFDFEASFGNPTSPLTRLPLTVFQYFYICRNMESTKTRQADAAQVTRFADMFSAMGTEPRLRIIRLLLSAHPEGMVVGDIAGELDIPNSTLSHHLDRKSVV